MAPAVKEGPAGLRAVVDACLEPDYRARPEAQEVEERLREVDEALASRAKVVPLARMSVRERSVEVERKGGRRPRSWRGLGGGVALSSLVLAGAVASAASVSRSDETAVLPLAEVPVVMAALADEAPDAEVHANVEARPLSVAHPEDPARASVKASKTENTKPPKRRRARPRSKRTQPSTTAGPTQERCAVQRVRADAAARRWAWAEVLTATSDRSCWPDPDARLRLRLTAWIEQRRFDACAREGAQARAPDLVRLVQRCRSRVATAGVEP